MLGMRGLGLMVGGVMGGLITLMSTNLFGEGMGGEGMGLLEDRLMGLTWLRLNLSLHLCDSC